MLGRAVRVCLRPAVFFSPILGIAILQPVPAFADNDPATSISALPAPTGPDQSSASADHVRKPTDPPSFDPKSTQAVNARQRAAARAFRS